MLKSRALRYDTKIKVYCDGSIKQKIYKDTKYKDLIVLDDDVKESKKGRVAKKDLTDDSIIRLDSLARSRDLLIDYASNNCDLWLSFVTLTFKDNVTDLDYANKKFNSWVLSMRRSCKKMGFEFSYLGVPEFQKRGAVHYHILCNVPCGSSLIEYQKDTANNKKMYDVKFWKHGFTSAFDIEKDTDDKFNVALYICKYLYKDLDERLFGHTRVLKSNNLKKPNEYYLMQNNDTYQRAYEFIKEKGYNITNIYSFEPTVDKSYITPFISLNYKTSIRDDNNTLEEILQNEGLEF